MWKELVFLYVHYDEFDNACQSMMKYPADAWEHGPFKVCMHVDTRLGFQVRTHVIPVDQ